MPAESVITVDDVAEDYVAAAAALDPVGATRQGITGLESEMTDLSPAGVEARSDLARRTRDRLRALVPSGEREQIACDVMIERLTALLDVHDAGEWRCNLNVLSSPLQEVRECFDLMATVTPDDWEVLATRMERVPAALTGLRATLHEGLLAGTPAARRQALACGAQALTWAGTANGAGPYFSHLVEAYRRRRGAEAPLGARLDTVAGAADRAMAEIGRWLVGEYAAGAGDDDAVGEERYRLHARAWNGTDLDLDETYSWGWEELRRIEQAMTRVAQEIRPGATIGEVRELLDTDPARAIEGEENLRQWLQALMDDALAGLDGTHFDIPPPLLRLEAMLAPPGGAAAQYYTGPSEDFARPGRTWYPTQGRTRFPLWGEVSTAYHEGVPGHHLQVAMTQYLKDRLNRFQRTMAFTAGHGEGWALYAERLMGELGYLSNPDYELGMLSAHAMRAARVVIDIGLHLSLSVPPDERFSPGQRWTPQLAVALLTERASQTAAFVASEVDRYLGLPGQAISYKVGERVWLAGREAARRRRGAAFDLRSFHARALELGPMGLADLSRHLENC
ncbi:MAG TPA: DUF885 domain-containing protein [Acidimicrobiales bacterium]|nr:DUF885 domain-containing protein [Acidimicrobiales bacterium]